MKKQISATIITLNEERHIGACISELQKFCAEIVVVDSDSSDRTVEIAKSLGARVFNQQFLGDGPQKALAARHAKYDWILSIDADESFEEGAIDKIKQMVLKPNFMYAFRRKNYVGNHWIRAAGFYPDYVVRLYNRNFANYDNNRMHGKVVGVRACKLPLHLIHHTYRDYSHWLDKINFLSSKDAWGSRDRARTVTSFTVISRSCFAFFKKLILRGGIFQGLDGWTVAMTTALKTHMKYLKLMEYHEQQAAKNSDRTQR